MSLVTGDRELLIETLDAAGDGATGDRIHVARTLPGEIVLAAPGERGHASLIGVTQPSADRVEPVCPHFAQQCGGCALQHMADTASAIWKRSQVVEALRRAGFADPAVGPIVRTGPRTRRRMDLAARRKPGGVTLGLHRARSKDIIDIAACDVLHPALFALVAPLRAMLATLAALRGQGSVIANLTGNGADLLLRTDGPLAPTDRTKLAAFAESQHVPRISWALADGPPETAAMLAKPFVMFGGARVEPPPGGFLQPSAEGEAAILGAVLAGLPPRLTARAKAVELFAGIGTLSFPLAAHLRVLAYEGDAASAEAARRAQAGSRVEMTQRDLARQPLLAKEFAGAVLIVLDPPHAGAAAQMPHIAMSGVPTVIYVSCNPAALARDAAPLFRAGYRLLSATPIDQFLWSSQIECICIFKK